MEFIAGKSLQDLLAGMERRLPVSRVVHYARQISELLDRIHAAGWVWRDCKPTNLILSRTGSLRPIDFEGAWPVNQPDAPSWASNAFAAPEVKLRDCIVKPAQDLYSLGVTLHYLLWGSYPAAGTQPKQRRNNSPELLALISDLLNSDPEKRPAASVVTDRLARIQLQLLRKRGEARI